MAIRIVRLGATRSRGEGLRLGTVRRLPRGVRKTEYAKRDYFDLWLPELAPSRKLLGFANRAEWTDRRWEQFARRYLGEMARPPSKRLLAVLAKLSHHADFSVGCYCEDARRCHRSLLKELLVEHGATIKRGEKS
jgi:uncharacterized protein YeaO (DUF488 family)